jgi:DNA-directed RNA polymerase III subunit RPC1
MGIPMTVGTGIMKLLHKPAKYEPPVRRDLMFNTSEFHLPEYS